MGETRMGRGAGINPANRFEAIAYTPEPPEGAEWEDCPALETVLYRDKTRSIIAKNDSPDIPFEASLNPYRGCEHGCVYCYARPTHEYLGFSSGLDFETKIMVKEGAPRLLRKALASPGWKPQPIVLSGVTDCYQPAEKELKITRGCLEVLAEFRNPVGVVTKSHLVTRDADLYAELARFDAAAVFVSVTTLDGGLARKMEPRASSPERRLDAIRRLSEAGVPVGVMVAPVIPALTDHEIPAILEAAAAAGATSAGHTVLRLPYAVKDLFADWLARHFPGRKERVLNRVRAMRGGKLNDPRFGSRFRGEGQFADQIHDLFDMAARRAGFREGRRKPLSTAAFRPPGEAQLSLFGDDPAH